MISRRGLARASFGVACILFGTSTRGDAQLAGGKIVHADDRRPLSGVTAVLRNLATDSVVQAVSDSAGTFSLFPPGPGRYVLAFRRGFDILIHPDTVALAADSVFERLFVLSLPSGSDVVHPDEIDSPVVALTDLRLSYPNHLRRRGLQGSVVARWVVDTAGLADMSTFKIVRSTEHAFDSYVRTAVSSAKFRPASARGRPVRQQVNRVFSFCLAFDPNATGEAMARQLRFFRDSACAQRP